MLTIFLFYFIFYFFCNKILYFSTVCNITSNLLSPWHSPAKLGCLYNLFWYQVRVTRCIRIPAARTLGSRGFSCAVSRFGQVVSSAFGRGRVGLWPKKLLVAREKKPLVPRVCCARTRSECLVRWEQKCSSQAQTTLKSDAASINIWALLRCANIVNK